MRIGTYIGMFSQIKKNIQDFCTMYLRKEKPLQVLKICTMILLITTPKTYIPTCRDNLGTEPLRFESSTEDRTYEVPYAATRQSHSTVHNNYVSNSLVYFCQLCTMDTLGAVTNLRNCPIFDVCPYCD